MKVFVHPIKLPKIIQKEWLEELYPNASPAKSMAMLEISCRDPKSLLLGVFDLKTKEIKGFLWGDHNELDGSLFINSIYVCKSCRKNPKLIGSLLDYIKEHYHELEYSKVIFLTKKPGFFLKRGCVPFEETCVKYEPTKEE